MKENQPDRYNSILSPSEGIFRDKGSKFIAIAFPIRDEAEIQLYLEDIRRQYHDARHHCYAWRLGSTGESYRINDDGEPSGTAGKPILGQMLSMEISDILVIVVRYFGGVKLGVGGLINAYKAATREALEEAVICTKEIRARFELSFEYPKMNDVMRFVRENGLEIESTDFQISCKMVTAIAAGSAQILIEKMESFYGMEYHSLEPNVYTLK